MILVMDLSKVKKNTGMFLFGAAGYALIEYLWRDETHWTMALTGGACFLLLGKINLMLPGKSLVTRSLAGAAGITAAELLVGVLVNLVLRWEVWDYSALPFNLLGQVCLSYSLLWFALCMPLMVICSQIDELSQNTAAGLTPSKPPP